MHVQYTTRPFKLMPIPPTVLGVLNMQPVVGAIYVYVCYDRRSAERGVRTKYARTFVFIYFLSTAGWLQAVAAGAVLSTNSLPVPAQPQKSATTHTCKGFPRVEQNGQELHQDAQYANGHFNSQQ